jgi:osmoprotectant transport system permease protein
VSAAVASGRLASAARRVGAAPLVWLAAAGVFAALAQVTVVLRDQRFAGVEATLGPSLWLPTLGTHHRTLLDVGAIDTGVPLALALVAVAVVEAVLGALGPALGRLVRPLARALAIFLTFWSVFGHLPLWDQLLSTVFPTRQQLLHPRGTVIEFAAQHLELVLVSSVVTISVGLLLGVMVTRAQFREFLPLVSDVVSAGQTMPTLAIVAIMVPIIGLGFWPTIVALILYGMLPVVRNTIAGIESVDRFVIESARGMGMTPAQVLWQIELPNASRIILAGIRTSVIVNVGTAALGAYAGSGGLGVPIAGGLSQLIYPFVLLGAVPAALLAILLDYVLGQVEFVLTPRGLTIES